MIFLRISSSCSRTCHDCARPFLLHEGTGQKWRSFRRIPVFLPALRSLLPKSEKPEDFNNRRKGRCREALRHSAAVQWAFRKSDDAVKYFLLRRGERHVKQPQFKWFMLNKADEMAGFSFPEMALFIKLFNQGKPPGDHGQDVGGSFPYLVVVALFMLAVMVNGLRTKEIFLSARARNAKKAVFTGVNAFREFQIVFQGELPAQKYAAGGQGRDFVRRKPVAEQHRYGQIACSAVRGVQKMFEKGRVDEIVTVNKTQIAPGSAMPHAQIAGGGNTLFSCSRQRIESSSEKRRAISLTSRRTRR